MSQERRPSTEDETRPLLKNAPADYQAVPQEFVVLAGYRRKLKTLADLGCVK